VPRLPCPPTPHAAAGRRRRRRGRRGVSRAGGLTLDELLERQDRRGRAWEQGLRLVLADEVERGRVHLDDRGRYRLVSAAFPPGVLEGLAAIGSANGRSG
jgi:hypothetical protein